MLFGVAYLLVRLLHLVLSAIVARDDPDRRGALLRFAPTAILGASLLVVAGFLDGRRAHRGVGRRARDRLPRPGRDRRRSRLAGRARALRRAARADRPDRARRVDHRHRRRRRLRAGYGSDRGARRSESSSSRRSGGSTSTWPRSSRGGGSCRRRAWSCTGSRCTPTATSTCRWSPASSSSPSASRRRSATSATRSTRCPQSALCGGAALYLLGHIAFLFRTTGRVFRRRTIGAVVLLALIPAALAIPALAALALVERRVLAGRGVRGAPLSRAPDPGQAPRARGLSA